jgi:hypothetical protein
MSDAIRDAFLEHQLSEAERLNAASDIVRVIPIEGTPPDRYVIDLFGFDVVVRHGDASRRRPP